MEKFQVRIKIEDSSFVFQITGNGVRTAEFHFLTSGDANDWLSHLTDNCGTKFDDTEMTIPGEFSEWLEKASSVTLSEEEDCELRLETPEKDVFFYFHTQEGKQNWITHNLKFMSRISGEEIQAALESQTIK